MVGIEEKPKHPKSNYAVIGIYMYDADVSSRKIRRLKPSGRGELEITDVNNFYIEEGKLTYEVLDGWWTDAGTFESLLRANKLVAETGANKLSRAEPGTTRRRSGKSAMKIFVTGGAGFIGSNFIRYVLKLGKDYDGRQLRQAHLRWEPRESRIRGGRSQLSRSSRAISATRPLWKRRCAAATRWCISPRNLTLIAAFTNPRPSLKPT